MENIRHRRFLLVTHPRSGSNLLVRLLALERRPDVVARNHGGYFFAPPFFTHGALEILDKSVDEWTPEEKSKMLQAYQDSVDGLEKHVQKAEDEDKIVLVKEHADWLVEPSVRCARIFDLKNVQEAPWMVQLPETLVPSGTRSDPNETVMPDEYLRLWRPIFLVRHPALAFPSNYRTARDLKGAEAAAGKGEQTYFDWHMTLHWSRTLYDWYSQDLNTPNAESGEKTQWPIVVDADDVMLHPEVLHRLSEIIGIDAAHLRFSWNAASQEDLQKNYSSDGIRRMASTISASSGVVPGKTSVGLDLDAEAEKWKEEFGTGEGERMERWVRAAMPDYEYMTARRLKPRKA